MSKFLKISVLVPVYGVEKYITDCAESLFAQTYKNVEYIFIDDCTPDDSIVLLEQCIDRHPERKAQVKILHHEQNRGIGATRLSGVAAATGEYLTFVDSDDYLPVNALEVLVEKMEESHADIVEGAFERKGCRHDGIYKPFHAGKSIFLKMLLCQKCTGFLWGKLYRRKLFSDFGITFTRSIDFCEDYSVVPCLFLCGKRAYTDKPVYVYRCDNENSYTHCISSKDIVSQAKANEKVRAFYADNDKSGKFLTAINLGILTVYRHAARYKVEIAANVDPYVKYIPCGYMFRKVYQLYHEGRFSQADMLLRTIRRVYVIRLVLLNALQKLLGGRE